MRLPLPVGVRLAVTDYPVTPFSPSRPTYAMLTRLAFTALRPFFAREDGDTMSQVAWSLGFVLLVGVIAVVVGPEIGANWREFVGKPTP